MRCGHDESQKLVFIDIVDVVGQPRVNDTQRHHDEWLSITLLLAIMIIIIIIIVVNLPS